MDRRPVPGLGGASFDSAAVLEQQPVTAGGRVPERSQLRRRGDGGDNCPHIGILLTCAPEAEQSGATWRLQTSSSFAYVNAVSCESPRSCTAVGESGRGGPFPLIHRWDGAKWSPLRSPAPTSMQGQVDRAPADSGV
jgi:hypothetical protein